MPELIWEGKDAVINYHHSLPVRELKIDQHESLNPEPSLDDNLIIEGDNIEVLKSLIPKFASKIDVIYIDPPYNTGNENWVYNDNLNSPQIKSWLGNVVGKEDLQRHDKWLCMMYPRLVLARELLSESGVIFISIDDNEVHNLKKICDEIFNEENFIANIIWEKKYTRSNDAEWFSDNHDHILCFAKNKNNFTLNSLTRTEKQLAAYKNPDKHPQGPWKPTPLHAKSGTNSNEYIFQNGVKWKPPTGTYRRYNDDALKALEENGEIWFGKDGLSIPQRKSFLNEVKEGVTPVTIWKHEEVGHNHESNSELKNLNLNGAFNNPKPTRLINRILNIASHKSSLILDFFAGSGTTGHAVLEMNKEDGGNRKFILIQQAEESEEASKQGFKNIFEITTARIRRCIKGVETAKDPNLKEGLGGSFTVVKLGEALHLNTLFLEKNLPSYEALASYLFYHTTNQALSNVTENTSHYIGKTENYKLYLIYSTDKEKLKHPDYALSRSKLEQILKDCGNGYQALIYAVTIYVDNKSIKSLMEKEKYTKKPIICQIPYQYLQINSANVLNNLEDSED
jgi:adenine-specific DNA-methyltransferase